jgi:hypothetical protein
MTNSQSAAAISKKAQPSEPIHEKTDAEQSCIRHVGKGLVTDIGDYSLVPAFLAEASLQEQNLSQSLFAGTEELVN